MMVDVMMLKAMKHTDDRCTVLMIDVPFKHMLFPKSTLCETLDTDNVLYIIIVEEMLG